MPCTILLAEALTAAASDPGLNEDLALALLKRGDLPAQALDRLSKNGALLKSRKVKLALVEHPRTPRHISVPMVRHLFTFDLMQVALTPAVPADIKESPRNRSSTGWRDLRRASGFRWRIAHPDASRPNSCSMPSRA